MDGVEDLLKPEWLTHKANGAGLQSPGPLAGLREAGRQARSSNGGSSKGPLTPDSPLQQQHSQQPRSSNPHGASTLLTANRSEDRPSGSSSNWSPRRQQHAGANGSSRGGSGSGSSFPSAGHHQCSIAASSRAMSLNERLHERSFGSSRNHGHGLLGVVGGSSARGSADAGSANSHVRGFGQRSGQGLQLSLHGNLVGSGGSGGANDKLHWRDGGGSRTMHAGAAARKLDLTSPQGFPSLAAVSNSHGNRSSSPHSSATSSSGRQGSPEHYMPSLAPYKQGFLASRAAAGWTSKLADVPAAGAAGTTGTAGAATGEHSKHERPEAVERRAHLETGDAADSACNPAGKAASSSAAAAAATAAPAAEQVPSIQQQQQQHQSLADTLKLKAVTSSAAAPQHAEALRRPSKLLVPLLPGCKAKHGSSGTRSGPTTGSLRLAEAAAASAASARPAAAAAAAGRVKSVELQSPTGFAALLKLSHNSSSSEQQETSAAGAAPAGSAVSRGHVVLSLTSPVSREAHTAAAAGLPSPGVSPAASAVSSAAVLSPAASSAAGAAAGAATQQCKLTGGVGLAGAPEQRQQLRDRNSFFAVLRRKTSSSSSSGGPEQSAGSTTSSSCRSSGSAGTGIGSGAVAAAAETAAAQQPAEEVGAAAAGAADVLDGADGGAAAAAGDVDSSQQQQLEQLEQLAGDDLADSCAAESDNAGCPEEQQDTGSAQHGADQNAQQDADQQHAQHHKAEQHQHDATRDSNHRVRSSSSSGSSGSSDGGGGMMWDVPAEEEAFLRSLGWTSVESDDEEEWGLTDEEIAAFQASAAARAAAQQLPQPPQQQQQQLEVSDSSYQQKLQDVRSGAKDYERPSGVLLRVAGTPSYVGSGNPGYLLQGRAAVAAPAMLLGGCLAPELLLGYDSCDDSSSSSDDDDGGGSAC